MSSGIISIVKSIGKLFSRKLTDKKALVVC
nr:MAG TPA: hypothetical protein [Caudoviricetes sp.]